VSEAKLRDGVGRTRRDDGTPDLRIEGLDDQLGRKRIVSTTSSTGAAD